MKCISIPLFFIFFLLVGLSCEPTNDLPEALHFTLSPSVLRGNQGSANPSSLLQLISVEPNTDAKIVTVIIKVTGDAEVSEAVLIAGCNVIPTSTRHVTTKDGGKPNIPTDHISKETIFTFEIVPTLPLFKRQPIMLLGKVSALTDNNCPVRTLKIELLKIDNMEVMDMSTTVSWSTSTSYLEQ